MIKIAKVFYNVQAQNFANLIKKIAPRLVAEKYVTNDFVKNIILREKKYPTGLAFNHIAIAIPHTDPQYVSKSGIIAIKTQKPIDMIQMATMDQHLQVSTFFVLLVKQGKFQVSLLTELMEKLNDQNIVRKIKLLNSAHELENLFN